MKTFLFLLFFSLPASADANPVKALTLREQVIATLKEDRQELIVTIEKIGVTGEQDDAIARLRARVAACETRIKELGGSFEPWNFRAQGFGTARGSAFPLTGGGTITGVTQDAAAVKVWREGNPYPSSMPHGVGGGK